MAQLKADFAFTGSMGNISAYKMRGSDKIIVRKKGGPTKKQVKYSRRFEKTRRLNAEFGGRSAAGRWIRHMLATQKALADHNISGPITALLKTTQDHDLANIYGERSVLLSKDPSLLQGFNLNKKNTFDSLVRISPVVNFDRANRSCQIRIPALTAGIHLFPPPYYPYYSFLLVLGIVPDFHFHTAGYRPAAGYKESLFYPSIAVTDWHLCSKGSPELSLSLQEPSVPPDNNFIILLSCGIRFGSIDTGNGIEQVPYAGAAKILAVE